MVVKGSGEARAMPDLATVRLGVDGEASSREEAYRRAAVTATAVDQVLADFDDSIERVITASLAVQPKTRWHKGERQRTGWQAYRVTSVEIKDTTRVGELLSSLAAAGANLNSLSWSVAPVNDSIAVARARAAQDARSRAEQYAHALGVRLGAVAWAAEPGLRRPEGRGGMDYFPTPSGAAAASGAEQPTIDVNPEEVTVRAELEVGFCIDQDVRS